jgi:hypothetical protein
MVIALHHAKAGRYAEKDRNQSPYSFAKIANWSNSAKSTPRRDYQDQAAPELSFRRVDE